MDIHDKKTITDNIRRGKPFTLAFKHADYEFIMMINGIYAKMLTASDQLYILNSVISIMREVTMNAEKANAKRLYFIRREMDINDPEDYKKTMKGFSRDIMQKEENFRDILMNSDFTVNIEFSVTDEGSLINVINSSAVLPGEMERIQYRIEKAKAYASLIDAYDDIEDASEGAGLGIALVIVTLKNIGIDASFFSIESGKGSTKVSLKIPRQIKPGDIITGIKERMVREIKDLPPFPASTIRIMELCDDPDSSFDAIAEGIMSDPALASGVMKLSNSAAFISMKRIESVVEAVRILGLRNVRSAVLASSARKIIDDRFSHFREIWDHSNQVACYARHIAQKYHGASVSEKASLAGLLHDLGKIILLATDPVMAQKIADQFRDRLLIAETFMEEISIGISHSAMGGLIAEGWNFPEYLIEAIRCHHSPLGVSKNNENAVHSVYLANMFSGIEAHKYDYHYIYESILEKYRLTDRNAFDALHAELKNKIP
jgi:putative nucleotidyltransferase with HDIG domain